MIGGTVVSHAPSTFYIQDVLLPILKEKMKIDFSLDVKKHGLFPAGGGLVDFNTSPVGLITPINITSRGELKKVLFRIASTENFLKFNLEDMVKKMFREIKKLINSNFISENSDQEKEEIPIEKDFIRLHKMKNTFTLFTQVILYYENTIVSVEQLFSEKKEDNLKSQEFISQFIEKFETSLKNENICLDEFTVDHLIIFMALAQGKSKIHIGEISLHTLTALEVIKKFIPDIKITKTENENFNILEIEGIGYTPKSL
jgi:RNA 3'-terminal phosphate cyclase (ATP)